MQTVNLSLERYSELIRAEQKAKQYKEFLINYSYKTKFLDILLTVEQKNLSELHEESRKNKEEK